MNQERTSRRVSAIAGKITGMSYAKWLLWAPANFAAVKSLAASALTQTPDKKSSG